MQLELEGFSDVTSLLRSGVYALAKRGVVIYVGKSKSLYSRIYAHRHYANRAARGKTIPSWLPVKGLVFDAVYIRPCALEDLDRLEWEMINRYKPHYNQNLKNSLRPAFPSNFTVGGVQLSVPPRPQIERRV